MAWASHKELGEINDFLIKSLPAAAVDAFGNPASPINSVERYCLEVTPTGTSHRFGRNARRLKLYDYTDGYGELTEPTKGPRVKFTLKSNYKPVKLEEVPSPAEAIGDILRLCMGAVLSNATPSHILVDNPKPGRVTLKGFNPNEALVFTLDTSPNSETVHGIVELIRQSLDA